MNKTIDLHVHSTASDGVYCPSEIVVKAKEAGLSALSLCDHDTQNGVFEAIKKGEEEGVEVISGVEITSYTKTHKEFHIVGYFLDPENQVVKDKFEYYQNVRYKRGELIVEKLQGLGFQITFEDVLKQAQGAIGKPHLTRAILENTQNNDLLSRTFGKIPNIGEFIQAFLNEGKPAYVEKAGMEPEETIKFIQRNGGLAVLAHPGWDIEIGDEETVKCFVEWGIDGLEAIHSKGTKEDTITCINYFKPLAEKYDLLITGGSDFHSDKNNPPSAGLGLLTWDLEIPYELLEKLKAKNKGL